MPVLSSRPLTSGLLFLCDASRPPHQALCGCAVVTGMNIIAILYVIFAGSPFGQVSNLTPFAPHGVPGIFAGAAIVYFSFVGFDTVATVAEEVSPTVHNKILFLAKSPQLALCIQRGA